MFPAYYGDNQMFCGGVHTQWKQNGGKCGICGENYAAPKKFERGGPMYRDLVVAKYTSGQQIEATVEMTANHQGYFQFSICSLDGSRTDATQQCLDKNILKDRNGNTKLYVVKGQTGLMKFKLNLPRGFTCNHCVFQWKYNAGNSWGTDPITGVSGIGEGQQEQFYGCSDIAIVSGYKRELEAERDVSSDLSNEAYAEKLDELIDFHLKSLSHLYKMKQEAAQYDL